MHRRDERSHAIFSNAGNVPTGISGIWNCHLKPDDLQPHFHRVIEIGICTSGSGISVTADRTQPFSAGDILIVFPFQTHRNLAAEGTCMWSWCFIDPFAPSLHRGGNLQLYLALIRKTRVYGIIREDGHPALYRRLSELLKTLGTPAAPHYSERICAMLTLLLLDMAEMPGEDFPAVTLPVQFDSILAALSAIQEKLVCGELPTVSALADICRMPLSTFRRVFEAVMGVSPKRHITVSAVLHAADLLLTTDKRITEIAGLAGFAEISTFNRAFRSVMGIAPTEYRAAQKK